MHLPIQFVHTPSPYPRQHKGLAPTPAITMNTEPPKVQQTNHPQPAPVRPVRVKSQAKFTDMLENRWIMLLVLFGVTAALGIPFLWKTKSFSHTEKILWTVIISLYTIFIFWVFFKIMFWCYANISDSLSNW